MELNPEELKKKINMGAVLPFLDGLANKVPQEIADLIKKILVITLIFLLIGAGVYGWFEGIKSATPLGMKIETDARSLFIETMEREYNRTRRDINIPDMYPQDTNRSPGMEYESFSREGNAKIMLERQDLMEEGVGLRNSRRKDPYPAILQTEYSDEYLPEPKFAPSLPPVQSQPDWEIQRKPTVEEKALPINASETSPQPKSEKEVKPVSKLENLVDRLEKIEKKLKEEPKPLEEKRSLEFPNR
jgi:hypothetical protein